MKDRQHMILRANELARTRGRVTDKDLAALLAKEFENASAEALAEMCLHMIRKNVVEPDLPPDNGQQSLPLELHGFLRVPTAEGSIEFVDADIATGAEALTALTSKYDRNSEQARRAKKKLAEVKVVMEWARYDKAKTYNENCRAYRHQLTSDA